MSKMFPRKADRESGVGLIAAIFVIVVLALLGTALIRLLTTEQASVNREFASTQGFFAAETAVQWGLYQVVGPGGSTQIPNGGLVFTDKDAAPAGLSHCDEATQVLDKDLTTGDNDMGQVPTLTNPGTPTNLYRFEVEGVCYQGKPEEARRRLEVRFGN